MSSFRERESIPYRPISIGHLFGFFHNHARRPDREALGRTALRDVTEKNSRAVELEFRFVCRFDLIDFNIVCNISLQCRS